MGRDDLQQVGSETASFHRSTVAIVSDLDVQKQARRGGEVGVVRSLQTGTGTLQLLVEHCRGQRGPNRKIDPGLLIDKHYQRQ